MELLDELKIDVMKKEMQDLFEEYARSMNLKLQFRFEKGFKGNKLFDFSVEAFKIPDDEIGTIEEKTQIAFYAKYWYEMAPRRGIDPDLLGKVIELTSRKQKRQVRYRILGAESLTRKKCWIACIDIETGKHWSCPAEFIKSGKIVA